PKVQVSPPSVDFGVVAVSSKVSRQLVISNSGNMALMVTQLQLQDVTGMFSTGPTPPVPLIIASSSQVTIDIVFYPLMEGSFSATLSLGTSDPTAKNVRVPINGIAAKGSFVLQPPQIAFPTTVPGLTGTPQTVSVQNTGQIDLMLCDAYLSGA